MIQKAQAWSSKIIWGGAISRRDAWTCLSSTILKTLEYPLGITCLTQEQGKSITTSVLKIALPSIGVNRNFRRQFVHGPLSCMGLDIPSLYNYQEAAHIDLLVSYWKPSGNIGAILRTSMTHLQLETGTGDHPFQLPYHQWNQTATNCWMKSTWKFAWENNITADLNISEIPLQREKDEYLMKLFEASKASPAEMASLNRCRLYLQVVSLADICEADGTTVKANIWEGSPARATRVGLKWPNQHRPGPIQWTL